MVIAFFFAFWNIHIDFGMGRLLFYRALFKPAEMLFLE